MKDILNIFVFNVGHGDNILLQFSTGSWGLIDFYYTTDQTEPPSITYLKNIEGDIIIDFVHISHYHHDHTRGLDKLFEWIEDDERVVLNKLWLPGMFPPKKLHELINRIYQKTEIISAAQKNGKISE